MAPKNQPEDDDIDLHDGASPPEAPLAVQVRVTRFGNFW